MLKKAFNFSILILQISLLLSFHIYIRLKFLNGAQVHVVDPNK